MATIYDEERKKRMRPEGAYSATDAAGAALPATDSTDEAGSSYGQQMTNVGGAIARGVGNLADAAGTAAGTAVKTLVSAPGYGMNAGMVAPGSLAPPGVGAGRGVVNPELVVPAAAPAGGAYAGRGTVNPALALDPSRLANVPNLGGDIGQPVAGAAGVRKIVSGGRTLYSNVPGGDNDVLMSGKPGVQTAPALGVVQPGTGSPTPGGEGSVYIPGVNAPLTQYEQETAARNAGVRSVFTGGGSRQDVAREQMANQAAIAAAGNETSRANNQATNATSLQAQQIHADAGRYGVDVGARTAGAKLAVEAPEQLAKTQLAISTLTARKEYADALASGDPKRVAKAENTLRAIQGKYEKDEKPVRHLVVQGGQQIVDGQLVHQPSVVFNPDTGEFLAPPQGGAGAAPGLGAVKPTPKGDYEALPRGASYIGTDGKKYIKG